MVGARPVAVRWPSMKCIGTEYSVLRSIWDSVSGGPLRTESKETRPCVRRYNGTSLYDIVIGSSRDRLPRRDFHNRQWGSRAPRRPNRQTQHFGILKILNSRPDIQVMFLTSYGGLNFLFFFRPSPSDAASRSEISDLISHFVASVICVIKLHVSACRPP
jgi:hypothetical protein